MCTTLLPIILLATLLLSGSGAHSSLRRGEHVLLVGCYTGAMAVLPTSEELILSLFILALANLSLYPLLGSYDRGEARLSVSVRYLLLGALSTTLFGLGTVLLYGVGGTTDIPALSLLVGSGDPSGGAYVPGTTPLVGAIGDPLLPGVLLVTLGLLLKVGAAPLSGWVPDTYGGCPPLLALLIVTVPKLPLLLLLGKVALPLLGGSLAIPAVLSLLLGVGGMGAQDTLRRWVAFSTIAHGGYMLLLLSNGETGGLGLYVCTYLPPTLILLGVSLAVSSRLSGSTGDSLARISGLGIRNRGLTVPLALSLFSLLGLPPLAGFVGKVYLLLSMVDPSSGATGAGVTSSTLIGLVLLSSLIGAGGYLRIARVSLLSLPAEAYREGGHSPSGRGGGVTLPLGGGVALTLSLLTAATLLLSWTPSSLILLSSLAG